MLGIRLLSRLAAALVFHSLTTNAADPEPTLAPQSARKYMIDCTKDEKVTEAKAWSDHLAIAKEAVKWQAGGRWQPAFDKYMGKDSREKPWFDTIKSRSLSPRSQFPSLRHERTKFTSD